MCFCKWLPLPMPGEETMLIYIIISILFGIYLRYTEALIPTTEITINSLDQCNRKNNTNLDVSIGVKWLENHTFQINGHLHLNFDIDDSIDLNVVKLDREGGVKRRYLKEVKLCKLLDRAVRNRLDKSGRVFVKPMCPIKAQKFEVDQVAMGDSSSILGVPYRFLNHPMQIELSRNGDTLACLEFDLKSKLKILQTVN
ncbi:unnamed protein product [Ceutorhynchus assimilis]|uniref:Uncharacterized protein n=1 Tax=Ceutorhynchus assimilis TaxID=467358 RepID=A0A9N9QM63_9CUCU|nr:unnamed protein product [Ceutorhynchus assimilis]